MEINVELFGQLRRGRNKIIPIQVDMPCSVQEIVLQLSLDPEEVGLIVINGVQSELADLLSPDCRLALFPYVSGG